MMRGASASRRELDLFKLNYWVASPSFLLARNRDLPLRRRAERLNACMAVILNAGPCACAAYASELLREGPRHSGTQTKSPVARGGTEPFATVFNRTSAHRQYIRGQ